jgi:hypothetical protein
MIALKSSVACTFATLCVLTPSLIAAVQSGGPGSAAPLKSTVARIAVPEPPVLVEPMLIHECDLRAIEIWGDPGRMFVLLAGVDRCDQEPLPGIHIYLDAIAVVCSGELDKYGRCWVPINDQLAVPGVHELLYQAVLCPPDSADLADQATELLVVPMRPFETEVPDVLPPEDLWLAQEFADVPINIDFCTVPGWPPQIGAKVVVDVPTSGYVLHEPVVLHAGCFTRVETTLERPSDAELLEERAEQFSVVVPLGVWVGKVEVLVHELKRLPPVYKPVAPRPIFVK